MYLGVVSFSKGLFTEKEVAVRVECSVEVKMEALQWNRWPVDGCVRVSSLKLIHTTGSDAVRAVNVEYKVIISFLL